MKAIMQRMEPGRKLTAAGLFVMLAGLVGAQGKSDSARERYRQLRSQQTPNRITTDPIGDNGVPVDGPRERDAEL